MGVISLASADAQAAIDVHDGFACTSLRVADWSVLGHGGIHVQFPWVGAHAARPARLRLGRGTVEIGGGPSEALARGPWTLEEAGERLTRALLRTDPTLEAYPFELELHGTWRLNDEGLWLEVELANRSASHAPFSLGVRVDLGRLGERVEVLAPAEEYWPRNGQGELMGTPPVAVAGGLDLRRPARVDRRLESLFTRRHFANLRTQLAVLAPSSGREVWLNTSTDFREAEVALEPDGTGVVESATSTPDAFALHAAGLPTGLRVLAPGETWRGYALVVTRPGVV